MKNNIWNKINNKNNRKSIYEISKETNIPEEKVEEIMNGERELPTERVDTFLEVIQKDDKAKRKVEIENIKQWVKETDLKSRRKELGYASQRDLAKLLKIHPSVICNLENKKLNHISDKFLKKYYDFINDDLNKVIKQENKVIEKEEIPFRTLEDEIKDLVEETKEENIIEENVKYTEDNIIKELNQKIAKLEKQIERYEKLIDRL